MADGEWIWAWVWLASGVLTLLTARFEARSRTPKPGKVMSSIGIGICFIAVFVGAATQPIGWLRPWLAFALFGVGSVLLGVGSLRVHVTSLRETHGSDATARDLPRGNWGLVAMGFAILTAALFWLDTATDTRGTLLLAVLACCGAIIFGAMWLIEWLTFGLDLWLLKRESRPR